MPSSRLIDNLDSNYIEAFSGLLPKHAPQRVLVYVESDEDIAFWKNILSPYETHELSFDIQLPVKSHLEKGKKLALEKSEELLNIDVGTHLIICVDSDYDYLLQNRTEQSRKINQSDFIFQTYSYSLENLLCYSKSLDLLLVQATKNNTKIIDLDELLEYYSKIIYKLFLWSVHFVIKDDETSFPLSSFYETIKILDNAYNIQEFRSILEILNNQVRTKILELETSFPNEIAAVEHLVEELKPLGLNEKNTYLFARGHTIKTNVVLMFLKSLSRALQNEKKRYIATHAQHRTEINNQINHYNNQIVEIEIVLNSNTEFKSCFLFLKIKSDLEQYIQQISSKIN